MNTKTKKDRPAKLSRTAAGPAPTKDVITPSAFNQPSDVMDVPIELIDPSPLNHRTWYDPMALEELARELSLHGLISPVTVRVVTQGRYELVVGERRYRAGLLAQLPTLRAMVWELTDEQVIEIQLVENIQREDPHPLHEAKGIAKLHELGHGVDEIAAKLGKSKKFVYGRLKLSAMIPELQEIFLEGKLTLQDAFAIASITPDSQQEFFEQYCSDWKKKNFQLYQISGKLDQYRYNLKRASFDTKSKTLLPKAGACTRCPFNTAVLKELFPEEAKEATCTNKNCYQEKCTADMSLKIEAALIEWRPVAIITNGISQRTQQLLASFPALSELDFHQPYDVHILSAPEKPTEEDHTNDYWSEEDEGPQLDQESFDEAIREYETELQEYNDLLESGDASMGLSISDNQVKQLLFTTGRSMSSSSANGATSKQVQQAIKDGTVTPELLQGEVARLQQKEKRYKQIDREKVQLKVVSQFHDQFVVPENNGTSTSADLCAARLIIYQSLDYHTRQKVRDVIFSDRNSMEDEREMTYDVLSNLTEQQHTYLVRMALCTKSESRLPSSETAFILYKTAEQAGVDLPAIEAEQQAVVEQREQRLALKVSGLEKRLEIMENFKKSQEQEDKEEEKGT